MTTLFGNRTAAVEIRLARLPQCGNTYDDRVRKTLRKLTDRQCETAPITAATYFDPWRQTTFAERAVVAARAAAILHARPMPIGTASNSPLDGKMSFGFGRLLTSLRNLYESL